MRDLRPQIVRVPSSFIQSEEKASPDFESWNRSPAAQPGYGFGRQGEKAAGMKGIVVHVDEPLSNSLIAV
jgi:hypothetical protein